MHTFSHLTLALAFTFTLGNVGNAQAQSSKPTPAKASKVAKAAPEAATSREVLSNQAKGLALATDTTETIDANRLGVAARVLTGKADCEFNLSVDVNALPDKPGYFQVRFKNASYLMVPEETTTGAVKLQERRSGVIWLQIPTKSMLLDEREGRRLVDACTLAEQRAAVNAATAAAGSMATSAPVKN